MRDSLRIPSKKRQIKFTETQRSTSMRPSLNNGMVSERWWVSRCSQILWKTSNRHARTKNLQHARNPPRKDMWISEKSQLQLRIELSNGLASVILINRVRNAVFMPFTIRDVLDEREMRSHFARQAVMIPITLISKPLSGFSALQA